MEDDKIARETTAVRVDECCRFEEELWRRAYERLLPPMGRRTQAETLAMKETWSASSMALAKGA